jgi:hypothetical protein
MSGNEKSGAGVPKGNIVLGVRTMVKTSKEQGTLTAGHFPRREVSDQNRTKAAGRCQGLKNRPISGAAVGEVELC